MLRTGEFEPMIVNMGALSRVTDMGDTRSLMRPLASSTTDTLRFIAGATGIALSKAYTQI
jgi:hypothetical protein